MSIPSIVRQSTAPAGRDPVRVSLTKQADKSLTDIIEQIGGALRAQFKQPNSDRCRFWYPKEVFDDYLIACEDETSHLFKISYQIDGDKVTFGDPVRVEEQYVEVGNGEATQVSQGLLIRQALDGKGFRWRFQVVAWGLSKTRHVWKKDVFAQSLKKHTWEYQACFADHPTASQMEELPERSIKDKVGFWTDFEVTEQGLDATLNIKPSAAWLRDDIQAAYDARNLDFYGASILVAIQTKQVNWSDGKSATEATEVRPISIDLVTDAAAGGRVKYALASARGRTSTEGENSMWKTALALLFKTNFMQFGIVRQSLVTAGAQGVTIESTEDQVADAIHTDENLVKQAVTTFQQPAIQPPATQGNPENEEIAFERLPQSMRDLVVQQTLRESGLPEAVQQNIQKRLGAKASLATVNREIEIARDTLAVMQGNMVVNPRAEVLADRADKYSISLAKAFGLTREEYNSVESSYEHHVRQSGGSVGEVAQDLWNTIPKLRSIREFYVDLTGDKNLTGRYAMVQLITKQATWLTSDFTELLSNVMNKRLLRDFRSLAPTWRRIATIKDVKDFKTQEAILIGEFGDLPTVSENGEYLEPSALSDTKEAYGVGKRGRVVSLSWETVVNDDLNGFVRVNGKLGRAAARGLLKFVWNTLFMSNPTLNADSKAFFHVDHNNLITELLATAGLKIAVTKLLEQTEPGSNEKMDVDTMSLTLAVPSGLYLDAQSLTDFNNAPGGETSALAQLVKRMGITPVAVPFFTDANDWALTCSPEDREIVEVGFLNGNEEPEFFTQMDATQGDYFAKDVVAKYKVRFVYGGAPVDFRGAVKSAVV